MPRYITFLRAINVGGHTVKMGHLRTLFESLGYSKIETFIASGNIVFETPGKNAVLLERTIGECLEKALGYEVATFVKTEAELSGIANCKPFSKPALDAAVALNIAFLHEPVDAQEKNQLLALRTPIDDFVVRGREVYWLCRRKQSQSTFSNAVLEKTLGRQSTLRGMKTIVSIAEKLRSSGS